MGAVFTGTYSDEPRADLPVVEADEEREEGSEAWGSEAARRWREEWFSDSGRVRRSVSSRARGEAAQATAAPEACVTAGRRILLVAGSQRFGRPNPNDVRRLFAAQDPVRIDNALQHLGDAGDWQELLDLLAA